MNLETLYRGINKLIIVDIALEQHDNPQLIFESLNSTGMDLSQSDLIRNYILMGLDNDEQISLYDKYWYSMEQSFGHTHNADRFNRFMRDFLTLHTGTIPNVDDVYFTFVAILKVREEYTKLYIAYKIVTNFVDVEPYRDSLKLTLNIPFNERDDPQGLCRDVSAVGHHGNGDVEVRLSSPDQLDDVMELIRQAFEEQWEEGAA